MNTQKISSVVHEFKTFALRGNVIDLAIGVIIGAAFGKLISAAVSDILMPFLGLFLGAIDVNGLSFTIGKTTFLYGHFIQTIIDFLIIASIIFLLVKALNVLLHETLLTKKDPFAQILEESKCQTALLRQINEKINQNLPK